MWGGGPVLGTEVVLRFDLLRRLRGHVDRRGALVVSRLPRHPVGWILCLGGLLDAVTVQLATGWGLRVVAKPM
jgi:hypothetical protein